MSSNIPPGYSPVIDGDDLYCVEFKSPSFTGEFVIEEEGFKPVGVSFFFEPPEFEAFKKTEIGEIIYDAVKQQLEERAIEDGMEGYKVKDFDVHYQLTMFRMHRDDPDGHGTSDDRILSVKELADKYERDPAPWYDVREKLVNAAKFFVSIPERAGDLLRGVQKDTTDAIKRYNQEKNPLDNIVDSHGKAAKKIGEENPEKPISELLGRGFKGLEEIQRRAIENQPPAPSAPGM